MIKVAISKVNGNGYPQFPYNPSYKYPEYDLGYDFVSSQKNEVYEAVRNNFRLLGYDRDNFGKENWNPLKEVVKPGTTVFIKPNFVDHKHRHGGNIFSVITHPSVIRAILDYVVIALDGKGKIIIGDNPHVDADFFEICKICKLYEIKDFIEKYYKIGCHIIDCRFWHVPDLRYYGFKNGRKPLKGDPNGELIINLKNKSMFKGKNALLFRGTYNERMETITDHIFGNHRYYFSRSIFSADTYISIPKLKTHAKVGVTLNIKGLIGTVSNKNCLVHWRIGFPKFGGDEYPDPEKNIEYFKLYWQHLLFAIVPSKLYFFLRKSFKNSKVGKLYDKVIMINYQKKKMLRGASYYNDTTWRMTVDVYNCFINDVTKYRKINNVESKFLSVVDGIIGGELDGPHFPKEKMSNVIITGDDLLSVDIVATRLMDLDIYKIKYLNYLINTDFNNDLSKIDILSNDFECSDFFNKKHKYLKYLPPNLWDELKIT